MSTVEASTKVKVARYMKIYSIYAYLFIFHYRIGRIDYWDLYLDSLLGLRLLHLLQRAVRVLPLGIPVLRETPWNRLFLIRKQKMLNCGTKPLLYRNLLYHRSVVILWKHHDIPTSSILKCTINKDTILLRRTLDYIGDLARNEEGIGVYTLRFVVERTTTDKGTAGKLQEPLGRGTAVAQN